MTQNEVVFKAKTRDKKNKAKFLRKNKKVPAVVYGFKIEPVELEIDLNEAKKIVLKSQEASVYQLDIDESKNNKNVIIQDLQFHKVKNNILHIDFYEVDMKKTIETSVPVEYIGISEAVKNMGGTLIKSFEKIDVKCLPANLPEHFEVDLSVLKTFDDIIHIKDLKVPEGVEISHGEDEVVAMTQAPRSEKELDALDEEVEGDVKKVEGIEDKEEEEGESDKKEGEEEKGEK